jgi:hypothetical protein
MYPPSTTRNMYKDVIGRSKEHGLTQVFETRYLGWLTLEADTSLEH